MRAAVAAMRDASAAWAATSLPPKVTTDRIAPPASIPAVHSSSDTSSSATLEWASSR